MKDMEKLAELVDASLKFTRVLKKKGVSQATLQVRSRLSVMLGGGGCRGGRGAGAPAAGGGRGGLTRAMPRAPFPSPRVRWR